LISEISKLSRCLAINSVNEVEVEAKVEEKKSA
jgi:hypothetical protein